MKFAVVRFPGSNCDQDGLHFLNALPGLKAEYVWHQDTSLNGFDGVWVPGGFSFGDYLRCGAVAAQSPIMKAVRVFAEGGGPVIGVCNGFQVLCEAGLLPGALLLNEGEKFVCKDVFLAALNKKSFFTRSIDKVIRIPIAHGEGRYLCDSETLARLVDNDQIAFRYVLPDGSRSASANPNGSLDDIAGVLNERGNVLGMMPHPERAWSDVLGGTDGRLLMAGLVGAGV